MNLDPELERALARKEPASGFADRVLARAAHERSGAPTRAPRPRRTAWLMAAAMAALAAGGGWVARHEQARRTAEGQRARDQVLAALEVMFTKVRLAQRELDGAARGRDHEDER